MIFGGICRLSLCETLAIIVHIFKIKRARKARVKLEQSDPIFIQKRKDEAEKQIGTSGGKRSSEVMTVHPTVQP